MLGSTGKASPGLFLVLLPLEVATIPARSSLEETSLGELLPGSILSDSLKIEIVTRSDGRWLITGQVTYAWSGLGDRWLLRLQ